ncbi:hypothetical protein MYAM1_000843 [Malassezia yamatoensis]|uniref:Protein kinase domain-containing protein n=1 Tax=Malassezia yamatoensis TaxID=253288 RepID=A0AAJ5YRY7_9BASI|nr:hypothetical protein MYAM1_000843 [Malassezia yamatoensis]
MTSGKAVDIPVHESALDIKAESQTKLPTASPTRFGFGHGDGLGIGRACSVGEEAFPDEKSLPVIPAPSARNQERFPPQGTSYGKMYTSVNSLDNEDRRSEPSFSPSNMASPAAQWLGSLNGSFASSVDSEASSGSLLQHLRRSSSTRRPERRLSMTSSLSKTENPLTSTKKRPPRADEEGYVFGPNSEYRLGRAIGFGESSVVYEGIVMDVKKDESDNDEDVVAEAERHVAIKVLKNTTQQNHSPELQLWISLPRHPHLLSLIHYERIYDTLPAPQGGTAQERVLDYLVMPYSAYGNLLQFVRREGAVSERYPKRSGAASLERVSSTDRRAVSASADTFSGPFSRERSKILHSNPLVGKEQASSPISWQSAPANPTYRSLSARHRSSGIPIDVARTIMRQVASALYSLHKVASVVHCDLKLENILAFPAEKEFNESDTSPLAWKIADFGLSEKVQNDRHMESWSRASMLGGTLAYAAPEVVRYIDFDMPLPDNVPSHAPPISEQQHTPFARDMWSLGCVLYAMLSGQLPFVDGMQVRMQQKILSGEYDVPDRLLTGKERKENDPISLGQDENVVYRSDPAVDTDEFRTQARDVLQNLLELDPTCRWNIDDLCQSEWLALY